MWNDIFEDCSVDWVQLRKMIIEGLFNLVQKLQKLTILEVSYKTVSKVMDIVAAAASMDIKVEWINGTLGEIAANREHYNLIK